VPSSARFGIVTFLSEVRDQGPSGARSVPEGVRSRATRSRATQPRTPVAPLSVWKKVLTVLLLASSATMGVWMLRHGALRPRSDYPEPPWRLPALVGPWPNDGPRVAGGATAGGKVLLYVDQQCRFCAAEMGRWSEVSLSEARLTLWVIASPASDVADLSWVPTPLRRWLTHDRSADIARALGVRSVPVAFFVDAADTVRHVVAGQRSVQQLRDILESMREVGISR